MIRIMRRFVGFDYLRAVNSAGAKSGLVASFALLPANSENVLAQTGIITTVADNGTAGFSGDGGPATSACLQISSSVDIGSDGSLFIADTDNSRIRRVDPQGIITIIFKQQRPTDSRNHCIRMVKCQKWVSGLIRTNQWPPTGLVRG